MRILAALGGNALVRRGEPLDVQTQRRHLQLAARCLARLAEGRELVITHGNGPQVGLLALRGEALGDSDADPLDVLGAESEGMIGYLIEQALRGVLPGREVATLLTQVEVDARDAAFAHPTKPIGPMYDEHRARELARARGFTVARDGDGYRRVVPSPEPVRVLELGPIRTLVEAGVVVVCAGGGGVPVVCEGHSVRGVEGVIDKDRSAALLALALSADALLLLTDVPCVYAGWPGPARRPIGHTTPSRLRALSLDAGSMGPKVEAACRFVERTGRRAAIGALEEAAHLFAGETGTQVWPEGAAPSCP